jgi:hypothetical protein
VSINTRGRIAAGAQAPAHLEAVDPGHQEIEHNRVDALGRQHVERFGALASKADLVALQRECTAYGAANGRFVVHHEDSHFSQFRRHS